MTAINIFILLFTFGCGPSIQLKNNQLESLSTLTKPDIKSYQKSGVFIKGTTNEVQHEGKTYTVSIYSSKNAQEFMASVPAGSQVQIIFTGGFQGNQVVLETVSRL